MVFTRDTIARDTFIIECQNFSESGENDLIGVGWLSITSALPLKSNPEKTVTIYSQGELIGNVTINM